MAGGQLKHVVDVERLVREDDQRGGYVEHWETLKANVLRMHGNELRKCGHHAAAIAHAVAPHASRYGLRQRSDPVMLGWLLDFTNAPERRQWLEQAHIIDTNSNELPR